MFFLFFFSFSETFYDVLPISWLCLLGETIRLFVLGKLNPSGGKDNVRIVDIMFGKRGGEIPKKLLMFKLDDFINFKPVKIEFES